MRVTNLATYAQFIDNYRKSSTELANITSQLSSGKKIANSFQNSSIYVDSMRLTKEQSSLNEIKELSSQAQMFADNSDQILTQFTDALNEFKTKLLQANNSTQDQTSLNAIANDLEKLKDHMTALANTSINGQYLFSGTAMKYKPIDENGNYQGNDKYLKAVISNGVQESYNITGKELFFGRDEDFNKKITTNVPLLNQSKLHPDIMTETDKDSPPKEVYITPQDSIRDLVGDNDDDQNNDSNAFFYVYGKKPSGESFKTKIELSTDKSVQDLLDKIEAAYGNTEDNKLVDVSLNDRGEIEIKDLKSGNEQIDFFILGAVDQSGGNGADVIDIDDLTLNPNVKIVEFIKSDFTPIPFTDKRVSYDRNFFEKNKDTLSSNISQITKNNFFAAPETKLVETAGISTLNGTVLEMKITDVNSVTHTLNLNLSDFSNFTIDGRFYTIFNADGTNTKADEFTYRQLTDIISMSVSGTLPTANTKESYDEAVIKSKKLVETGLDDQGRLYIKDKTSQNTNIQFAIYDKNGDNFANSSSPVLTFQANDALTIDKPSLNIFQDMDEIIKSVREGRFNPDGEKKDPRLPGINAAIERIDHITTHIIKKHTKIGSISNSFRNVQDRSTFLHLNVTKLKSEIEDVDVAEALMKFNQINLNFQAMLSSIAKINSLSLVNYI